LTTCCEQDGIQRDQHGRCNLESCAGSCCCPTAHGLLFCCVACAHCLLYGCLEHCCCCCCCCCWVPPPALA
jgi:hypothetical protein